MGESGGGVVGAEPVEGVVFCAEAVFELKLFDVVEDFLEDRAGLVAEGDEVVAGDEGLWSGFFGGYLFLFAEKEVIYVE